jgi:hypothetical protein
MQIFGKFKNKFLNRATDDACRFHFYPYFTEFYP